jgi:3-methylfumaryl-CoA hydratase
MHTSFERETKIGVFGQVAWVIGHFPKSTERQSQESEITMVVDTKALEEWIGRTESSSDSVTRAPIAALSATLDRESRAREADELLPPFWHWLYFLPIHRQSALDQDGHLKRGEFLPPVPLPRRMWAGSRLEFHRPLRVGDRISRASLISDVTYKEGRSGPLVFVTVRHQISNTGGLAVTEHQDLVFRENPRGGDPAPKIKTRPRAQWQRVICPDPILLFRYSALTFNAHRIHYDRPYAVEVEGYPGLVVHGPLIATLLLELLDRNCPGRAVRRFTFRAIRPLFDTAEFSVCGGLGAEEKNVELWAQDKQGGLAMEASAELV